MVDAIKMLNLNGAVIVSPPVISALIALLGVIVGLIARDVIMAVYLARRKRAEDLADRREIECRDHQDLVRLYADPLREAVSSLKFRLQEIIEKKQGRYLRSDAPKTPFLTYKRISTLYRIAALLGWIRAVRRERSYLDPKLASASSEMKLIGKIEAALADGDHVELQRLQELMALWGITTIPSADQAHLANRIDAERADFLAANDVLAAADLSPEHQGELARRCADLVVTGAAVPISDTFVAETSAGALAILGIKEAYIYRDWQAAIGDLMLEKSEGGPRHFSVLGFGAFETMLLKAESRNSAARDRRWFERLQLIILDLDMTNDDRFDARRGQLRELHQCCIELEAALAARISPAASAKSLGWFSRKART